MDHYIIYLLIIGIIIILLAGYIIVRNRRRKAGKQSKVTEINQFRTAKKQGKAPAKPKSQLCSLCRKPAAKLSFYSDEVGRVIGTCRDCKRIAERRNLDRL